MKRPGREAGWLGSPPGASFVPAAGENPFLRYRRLLWSRARFAEAGRTDGDFVAAVAGLDERVAAVDGRGFRVTPLLRASELGDHLGVELRIKDETGNVTRTHKARHLMGLALHLDAEGVAAELSLAIASCGNAALAAATVARAAGRPLDVFIPPWADAGVVAALADLGARIEVCPRRPGELGDPCFSRFREATAAGASPFCAVATENIWTIDGGRTLAFEMVESLAAVGELDALFVQVGGGALASSVVQGFVEAADEGVVSRLPVIYAVQTEGCAPLRGAWQRLRAAAAPGMDASSCARGPRPAPREAVGAVGMEDALRQASAEPERFMRPWQSPGGNTPQSIATGILDDVTYDWLPIAWGMAATSGDVVVVPEDLVVEAHALARRLTDVPVDPTGTAGLAGLLAARRAGLVADGARVAVLFTGADRSIS